MKTIIVTPVGNSCNLRCDYCYHGNLPKNKLVTMDGEILEIFIRESLSLFGNVRYVWHGGEPMLAGLDFYMEALSLQNKYKKPDQLIVNGIQTNATLINERWGEFLVENSFYVSVSLDGTRDMHNLHRDNSYDAVVVGIKTLYRYIDRVGIILVVNRDNVRFPDRVYKSFCDHSWFRGFELHPCMPVADSDNSLVPSENELVEFMCRIFDLWWEQDDPKIIVRTLRDIVRSFLRAYPVTCASQRKGCLHITSVDYDGSVYTCSRFMKERVGYLGDIKKNSLRDIFQSELTKELYQLMVALPDECLECRWLNYCGGGCAYQRWLIGWGKYYQCNTRRRLFEYVVSKLQEAV